MKDIHVFICENKEDAVEITQKYFATGRITYAALFEESSRDEVTAALDRIQEGQLPFDE